MSGRRYRIYVNGESDVPKNVLGWIRDPLDSLSARYPDVMDNLDLFFGRGYTRRSRAEPEQKKIVFNLRLLHKPDGTPYNVREQRAIVEHVLYHEYAHLLYADLPDEKKQDLQKAYDKIMGMRKANKSLMAILYDGSYIPGSNGHPWDNPDELFASAFAIKNLHYSEFQKKCRYLYDTEKKAMDELMALVPG